MLKKTAPFAVPTLLIGLCLAAYFGFFIRPALVDRGKLSLLTSIDFHSYFMPRFELGSKELFAGRLPLWNRFEYGGMPLLATGQPAVFYLPKILLYGLLSPVTAHWAFLIVHYVGFAVAFLLFLRDRYISGISGFVGVALFLFSIPILDSNYHPIRIANFAWMPLIYLLADRVARGSTFAFGGLALVVAVELTAGYPEIPMDIGVLLAVHAFVAYWTKEWARPPWQTLPVLGAAFALGAVAAAAQLLPLGELGKVASRETLAEAGRNFQALHPTYFQKLLGLPFRFRTPLLVVPGLMAFPIVGLFVPKGRLAAAGFVATALMFAGGWRLFKLVPGFAMVRFPLTWAFLAFFFIAWAGAAGCDTIVDRDVWRGKKRIAAGTLIAAAGLAVAMAWGVEWGRLGWHPSAEPHAWSPNVGTTAAASLGVLGGLMLALTAIVWLGRGLPRSAWIPSLLVLVLSHLDGVPFDAIPAPFTRPFRKGVISRLRGDTTPIKGRALSIDDVVYGYEITDNQPSALGVELSFLPARYRHVIQELGFVLVFGTIDWEKVARASGFLDALDVEYIAAPEMAIPLFARARIRPVRRGGDLFLFENSRRMGHAWINYAVKRFPTEDESLKYVLGPDFDPHREVVLEESMRGQYPEAANVPADSVDGALGPDGSAEFTVDLPRDGILVVSESDYPGRVAFVDGKPAAVVKADYVLYGVELARGLHHVRFEYRPASVRWGIALSAIGASVAAGILYFGRRRLFWAC